MIEYVAGFAFKSDCVLLIRKARPEWQAGKLNAVGGKIEMPHPGFPETPVQAMVREFREETGVHTQESAWRQFTTLCGPWGRVHFFATSDVGFDAPQSVVTWVPVNNLNGHNCIRNIRWLVPMALSWEDFVEVVEPGYVSPVSKSQMMLAETLVGIAYDLGLDGDAIAEGIHTEMYNGAMVRTEVQTRLGLTPVKSLAPESSRG